MDKTNSMKPDVYLCSKPLQYFNIKNICDVNKKRNSRILVLLNAFIGADVFFNNVRQYDKTWDNIVFCTDLKHGLRYVFSKGANNLFVDNDLSWRVYLLCLVKRVNNVYTYEEGIGSYSDIREYEVANGNRTNISRLLRKILRMGLYCGDSKYCKNIILYKPSLYNNKLHSNKAISFQRSFLDCLNTNETLFLQLSDSLPSVIDVTNKKILIYATEWHIQNTILIRMKEEQKNYDICIIKPHPHIKELKLTDMDKVIVLKTNVMMELILNYLIKRNNHVTVWHQCSTCVVHFLDRIESVCFPINPEYEKVFNEYTMYEEN